MTTSQPPTPPGAGLRARQVHLDFHTSPLIPDVAADFDAEAFVRTMRDAHVDSVTVFAVCHHGMCYYPSRVGTPHPHLRRDLLGEQVEALHRHGLRAPGYITVGFNEEQANRHPEWRQVAQDGRPVGPAPVARAGEVRWQWLCTNGPYADHVAAIVEEVVTGYPVDGLFMDILMTVKPGCVCAYCLRSMLAAGLDPANDDHLRRHSLAVERAFMERISRLAWGLRPDLTLFFNSRLRLSGDPALGSRPEAPYYSHWEIESLASGGWGYTHFALYNRYFQTLGKPILGMTAAFHRSWADFGTVKSQAALDYECLRMLAGGATCSVGDQLHPRGVLNPETYRRLALTYGALEAREPWRRGAVPLAEVGIVLPLEVGLDDSALQSVEGALHMLLQLGAQVAVVDLLADFTPYRVLILPDTVVLHDDLATRLRAYLAGGGALIASHRSGLNAAGDGWALDQAMGVDYLGPSRFDVEFLRPHNGLEHEIPPMDHALYDAGSAVRARQGTQTLAMVVPPYFSRTWQHFSSHAQTPTDLTATPELAAVTLRDRVAYLAHPLFGTYHRHGYPVYRQVVGALLSRLLPDPLVRATLPTSAELTLLRQPAADDHGERLICHVLHYVPQRRTPDLDLVEDVTPLLDVAVAINTGWTPRLAYLAPTQQSLPVTMEGAYAHVEVPRVDGHAMIVLER